MKNQFSLKYPCVLHEVYTSENLEDLIVENPKITCTQNWGTNKIIINHLNEKVLDLSVPKDLGLSFKTRYARIDITTEAEGIIELLYIDVKTLLFSEFENGLVTKINDNNGNEVLIYGKGKASFNTFNGSLKDKWNNKTIYFEFKNSTYKQLRIIK